MHNIAYAPINSRTPEPSKAKFPLYIHIRDSNSRHRKRKRLKQARARATERSSSTQLSLITRTEALASTNSALSGPLIPIGSCARARAPEEEGQSHYPPPLCSGARARAKVSSAAGALGYARRASRRRENYNTEADIYWQLRAGRHGQTILQGQWDARARARLARSPVTEADTRIALHRARARAVL